MHGLWLLPSSWNAWREFFEANGYVAIAPSWPDDPETVEEARANPSVFAGKSVQGITDHVAAVIDGLDRKPIVIGHSFGGLIAQKLAGDGARRGDRRHRPGPIKGVLPLPFSALKVASAVVLNPSNYRHQVMLTEKQFRYGFANAVSETEAAALYATYPVPGPASRCSRRPLPTSDPAARRAPTPPRRTADRC
ncbi:MAG: alpha/beta hydrolase [Galbitalea sp.]